MSSPEKSNPELKAGHAPAVKAGGMRIKAPRAHEEKITKEEAESPWEGDGQKPAERSVIVSGAMTHGDKDFTPASVKVAHEKPMPSHQKPPPKQQNMIIQQPR
uniref:death-associated protein 1-like n=1 Tax=Styela clava TaxID=7725 RepID=UPI0019395DB9|nr:death-associated protein 1-like [Styela clava]